MGLGLVGKHLYSKILCCLTNHEAPLYGGPSEGTVC